MPVKINNKEEEILLCDITGLRPVDLYASGVSLDSAQEKIFDEALKKRRQGVPLQHIMGKTEFYGLFFKVSPDVLIPRPETEVLVEAVIEKCRGVLQYAPTVLDLCTGSGCIAICLAKYARCGKIIATDISQKALQIAAENADLNGVSQNIEFKKSDLFKSINGRFDLIVSNPPYIKRSDISKLPVEVSFDPLIALDGGEDGLDFYRKIAKHAPEFLKPGGIMALEVGDSQAQDVKNILGGNTQIIKDLNEIERVLIWTK